MNANLKRITDWMKANKLFFNIRKTKYMIFKLNHRQTIIYQDLALGNELIDRVESMKFLGIIFDEKLNWNAHHQELIMKIRKSKYIFRQCKYLDSFSKYKLYMSYVYSHLIYGTN